MSAPPPGYVYYQYPQPPPEPPKANTAQVVRLVLILAAIAGVVTVIVGLVFWMGEPQAYTSDRTTINVNAGDLAPTVGPGGPGASLTQAVPSAPPPVPKLPPAPAMQPATPKRLIIPKLGVNAPITQVGLDKHGVIIPPTLRNANLAGWYRGSPTPGQAGPAVLVGHKDTQTRTAVFARLAELSNGDTIEIVRQDGTVAVFTVGGIEQADKTIFPTQRVYGNSTDAEMRLITCGGTYNRTTGHYVDNVIVYATMTSTKLAAS